MDQNTIIVIVAGIFAVVVIIGLIRFRSSGSATIEVPGMKVQLDGKNKDTEPEPETGITAKDLTSRSGGVQAESSGYIKAEKVDADKDIILTSKKNDLQQPPDSSKNTSEQTSNAFQAQGLYAQGNITLQQFVGNQIPLPQQLDFFAKQIGLTEVQLSKFNNAQFESYSNVWKSLQALRLAGDDLWEAANSENLLNFAKQLRKTETIVREGEIFFEDNDRANLLRILKYQSQYRIGKQKLIEIRSQFQAEQMSDEIIYLKEEEQINENFLFKNDYEYLLEDIRESFKRKLSGN